MHGRRRGPEEPASAGTRRRGNSTGWRMRFSRGRIRRGATATADKDAAAAAPQAESASAPPPAKPASGEASVRQQNKGGQQPQPPSGEATGGRQPQGDQKSPPPPAQVISLSAMKEMSIPALTSIA